MLERTVRVVQPPGARIATLGMVLLLLPLVAGTAWPQAAPQPSLRLQPPSQPSQPGQAAAQPTEPAPPSDPVREESPGLINEMGKLFEKSLSILPRIKSPSETINDFNARAKDAGETLSNMAKPSSVVTGRSACLVAANGAPDCKAGADKLCQSKGYKEGKSLDTDAAEKCSPKVYLPGYKRGPGDCKTENYVTKALCQ